MDLERLLELAGVPVNEADEKDLKAKAKKEFAKTAGMDDKAVEIVAKKLGISTNKCKKLLDESLMEGAENVKGWSVKDFVKGLKNQGMTDNPHFGDIKFMTIGKGDKKDGQYLAVVEDDNEGVWMVTWIFAWYKDGEPRADWSGSPVLEGFASKRYANEALNYIAKTKY